MFMSTHVSVREHNHENTPHLHMLHAEKLLFSWGFFGTFSVLLSHLVAYMRNVLSSSRSALTVAIFLQQAGLTEQEGVRCFHASASIGVQYGIGDLS